MVPQEVVLFLTLEVVPKLTLERPKSGTKTNSPKFKKRPLSRPSRSPKKGVHFRATLFMVGFIFETLRLTTDFFVR